MSDSDHSAGPLAEVAPERSALGRDLVGLARGLGGALIFALPMLMTMEMWWLGFYMDRLRLALLLVVNIPLLVALSHYAGFERTLELREDLRDAFIAYGIGILASLIVLCTFGEVRADMPLDEVVGKVAVQTVPASIGALLARSQLGGGHPRASQVSEGANFLSQLFLMAVGALFLGLNVAPTEEMILLAYQMTGWHSLALIALSILVMHGFVYAVEFRGEASLPPGTPWWSALLRFTFPGYLIAALISLYVLWTFGRADGVAGEQTLMAVIVLAFPASVGAAAARLIL